MLLVEKMSYSDDGIVVRLLFLRSLNWNHSKRNDNSVELVQRKGAIMANINLGPVSVKPVRLLILLFLRILSNCSFKNPCECDAFEMMMTVLTNNEEIRYLYFEDNANDEIPQSLQSL